MDEFQRVAMAHPSISFTLIHNGSELYNLPSSNYRQRIVNIFGGKTNEKLVPVSEETELINITGFVGKSEFAKKSRGEQFFFVNDRYIKSAYLHHAIMSAYEGLLKEGNQPSYFLYLQVPPHTIDINIHPTKTEIKFDDEHSLYAILRSAVKHSLGQFNVAPVLDFERDSNLDTPYQYKDKEADFPTIQVDSSFNPFATDKPVAKSLSSFGSYKRETSTANWESLYVGLKQETQELEQFSFESEEVTGKLFDDEVEETKSSSTYQIHKKYIVSAIKSGMLVIDQGRAHQRVLYEQFLTSITVQKASSQQLLFPLELYFSSEEMVLLKELQSSLENTGFVFDVFKSDSVQISGLPILMAESEVSIVLEELINNLQNEIPESSFSQSDSVAKSMAKSMAVKTGTYLSVKEQENLVNSLFACKDPNVSPFQKPTFITLTVEDLDKRFAL
jgi:DNA mismatch repair protein MutL